MSVHTPGPWKQRDDQRFVIAAPGNVAVAAGDVRHFDDSKAICDVRVNQYGRGREESEANARLIAAAPELLAALVEAEEFLDSHGTPEPTDLLTRMRAAIAKAEGR